MAVFVLVIVVVFVVLLFDDVATVIFEQCTEVLK